MKLLYVDLFCGAGGTSTGVESAMIGDKSIAKVIACVNHDANAIASHAANHPDALHFTEDIRTLELSSLISHVEICRDMYPDAFLVLWASLECTNFSKAKGGLPRDGDSRTLAEHLFRYIEALDPDYIQIENVKEFQAWGDIDENGKPVSMDKGRLYQRWVNNVKKYGYSFDKRILNSANFGAYTTRERFFGQFAKYGLPIAWPEPTHCKGGSIGLFGELKHWKAVKDVLDLFDEGVSIFNRLKPLAEKTLERIYAGLVKFVAGGKDVFDAKWNSVHQNVKYHISYFNKGHLSQFDVASVRFLSKYYSGHPASKNISLDGPAHTIKCVDNHALVNAEFLAGYAKQRVVSCQFVDQQFGKSKPSGLAKPLGSITTNPKYNLVSCNPWVMSTNFGNIGHAIDEPAQVVTANRKWPYLMNPQFQSAGSSIDDPCFTLIARMDKRPPYFVVAEYGDCGEHDFYGWIPEALEKGPVYIFKDIYSVCPALWKIMNFMVLFNIVDIKMRMLKIVELKRIMGFPEDYVLIGNQGDQKKYIGNAVEVNMAKALAKALAVRIIERKLKPVRIAA